MTTRNRPNYGIYYINMTNAGLMDVPAIGTRVAMVGAYSGATIIFSAGGAQGLSGGTPTSAIVGVQIGKALGDVVPMSVGNSVRVDNKYDFIRFSWPAQAGVIAVMALSDDAEGNGIEFVAPPSVTLGNIAIEQGGNTALVSADGSLHIEIVGQVGNSAWVDSSGALFTQIRDIDSGHAGEGDPSSSSALRVYNSTRIGTSSVANSSIANGATTILAAASNTNGVTIKAGTYLQSSNANNVQLCAGTVAPTSLTSNPSILTAFAGSSVATPQNLAEDIFLPPGQGLYLWASALGGQAFGTYTVH